MPRPPARDVVTWREGTLGLPLGVSAALAPLSSSWQFWIVGLAGFGSMMAIITPPESSFVTAPSSQPGQIALVLVTGVLLPLLIAVLYPRVTVRRDSHRHEEREQHLIAVAGPQDDVATVRVRFDSAAGPRVSRMTRLVGLWPLWVIIPLASIFLGVGVGSVVERFVDRPTAQQTMVWVAGTGIAAGAAYLLSVVFAPRKPGGFTETLIRDHRRSEEG